jgi:hypothetical protein
MSCKGICIQHRAQVRLGGRYANGQKRCQVCQIYIKWDGLRCPCCGCKVRSRPRNSKSKKDLEVTRKSYSKDKNKERRPLLIIHKINNSTFHCSSLFIN